MPTALVLTQPSMEQPVQLFVRAELEMEQRVSRPRGDPCMSSIHTFTLKDDDKTNYLSC